mgnify:CR=1 FL=1
MQKGGLMEWNQVLEHPSLQNIPFKVELNEWGNIVMTPASNLHGNLQVKIAMKLMQLRPQKTSR